MTDSVDICTIFDHIKEYGLESIEMEYKFGKVSKAFFDRVYKYVTSSDFDATYAISSTTRNEFNGTDARREYYADGTYRTVYKKRLENALLSGPVRFCVSIEREGHEDTSAPYTMYRTKHRDTFSMLDGAIKLDMTRLETNDVRYSDQDDYVFEIELEIDTASQTVLYYPLEHIIATARDLALKLHNIGSQCK
jgi:hypothetical protein